MGHTDFEHVAWFHGHVCPGLALGYRMTRVALERLDVGRSEDEHLVAVVENDACGVDAVQYLSGCTFGKGNLIFHDYGKQVYTFFHRGSERALRVSAVEGGDAPREREQRIQWLLEAPWEQVVKIAPVERPAPDYARIHGSVTCAFCGERVMESRARVRDGRICCIPCAGGAEGA